MKNKKENFPVDLPSSKPDEILNRNKNKRKEYRVTYTSCTDIENDYLAESETEAKAMFCREQGLPVKDFIQKLKVRKLE